MAFDSQQQNYFIFADGSRRDVDCGLHTFQRRDACGTKNDSETPERGFWKGPELRYRTRDRLVARFAIQSPIWWAIIPPLRVCVVQPRQGFDEVKTLNPPRVECDRGSYSHFDDFKHSDGARPRE